MYEIRQDKVKRCHLNFTEIQTFIRSQTGRHLHFKAGQTRMLRDLSSRVWKTSTGQGQLIWATCLTVGLSSQWKSFSLDPIWTSLLSKYACGRALRPLLGLDAHDCSQPGSPVLATSDTCCSLVSGPVSFCSWLDSMEGPWIWFITCCGCQWTLLAAPDSASYVQNPWAFAPLLRALPTLELPWVPSSPALWEQPAFAALWQPILSPAPLWRASIFLMTCLWDQAGCC